jgi:hypothetical protein
MSAPVARKFPTPAWCCAAPTLPRWRYSGRHFSVKIVCFLPCYFLFMPTTFKCTRTKQTSYKKNIINANDVGRGLLKSALWAYSNPKWPVECKTGPQHPPWGEGDPTQFNFGLQGASALQSMRYKSELPHHKHWLAIKPPPNPK